MELLKSKLLVLLFSAVAALTVGWNRQADAAEIWTTANATTISHNSFPQLEGNTLATITTNWLTPFKRRRIEVTTEDGYLEADLIAQELSVYSAYKDDDTFLTRPCRVQKGEPLANELRAFVQFLATGERGDLATIEDSVFTLRVLEQAE